MALQIFKQPNGLYAEFSTIIDAFLICNATAEEIIQNARHVAAIEAELRCKKAIQDADSGKAIRPMFTWEEAIEIHNNHCLPENQIDSNGERLEPGSGNNQTQPVGDINPPFNLVEDTLDLMKKLTDDQRVEVLNRFCRHCGSDLNYCQCWKNGE